MIRLLNVPVPRCLTDRALGRRDDAGFIDTYVSRTQPRKEARRVRP